MKKIIYSIILLLVISVVQSIYAVNADDIVGVWKTDPSENGYSHVEIYPENGKYYGKIIFLSSPTYTKRDKKIYGEKIVVGEVRKDLSNPDKKLRDRGILNLLLMQDFQFKDRQWRGGKIYDPESGKTYKCKMWLNKDGTLGVRGFVGIAAFGRSTVWTRVSEEPKSLSIDDLSEDINETLDEKLDTKPNINPDTKVTTDE